MIEKSEKTGITEIARLAKVSKATVDRVLYNRGRVSEDTREKILNICKDLNYQPNILAQRLASDKVYKFAVLIPKYSRDNPYWKYPLKGIENAEEEIENYGVTIKKYFYDLKDIHSFRKESLQILTSKPDGIVFAPEFKRESKEFSKKCAHNKIPYIYIDSTLPKQHNLSYFGQNTYQGGYLAGKLMSLHLKRYSEVIILNFANELENYPHFMDREKGMRDYFAHNNFHGKITTLNISPDQEIELKELIKGKIHHRTRGLFITSSAHKVARQIQKIGKGRLLIQGYDLTTPNLKYLENGIIDFLICQKPVTQGYLAINALFDHLVQKKEIQKENFMPIEIITKENYQYYLDSNN